MKNTITPANVRGTVHFWKIWDQPTVEHPKYKSIEYLWAQRNQLQYDWGTIAAQTIGLGKAEYRVRAMYIEYHNVANVNDVVTPPTYARDVGISYYTGLSAVSNRDYLRVPLALTPTTTIGEDYSNYFSNPDLGNVLRFFAQTQGVVGVHGRPFAAENNSKIIGAALVATPDFQDPTKDLVFSRTYLSTSPTNKQLLKPTGGQIGLTWEVLFS